MKFISRGLLVFDSLVLMVQSAVLVRSSPFFAQFQSDILLRSSPVLVGSYSPFFAHSSLVLVAVVLLRFSRTPSRSSFIHRRQILHRNRLPGAAMTNPKRTGKELVHVVYAIEARPLVMIDPTKEMRQKKSPRKRTAKPVVINIDDSAEKYEVVKSSSPSPRKKVSAMKRKGSQEADVAATVQTSSRTPNKNNTEQHDKRPETKMVYEKKRKRPNREYEEVIDLNTPTKKMQRDKDMEEREDKGIKRKIRHQVSKGGCSNRKPDVKQKVKGDEEEEEWDEDEGDQEENRKEGQKRKGVNGKKGQPKKGKVETKRKIQYRSTLNTVVKLIRSIPTGQFTPLQVQEIKKTPFAEFLLGIVEANLDEAYVRKSDPDVLKLVKQYEGTGGRFKLGGKSVKLTAKEVTLIFGIQSGPTRIVLNPTPRVPKLDFADRLCLEPKGQRILTIPLLREFFAKTVEGTSLQDAKDLVRVLCLLLIGTLFFTSTQARMSWGYLEFVFASTHQQGITDQCGPPNFLPLHKLL
ncbi:hypothetical protein RHMOL_Rhmol06G0149300 [Rhododendron molle]|uniref:Uncharacterized protein n=1 Tax=Rhododendron molle TaxID=49168 RepID=A0ACC0NDL2_RHOML|nr:hypothetical protein RHMOL_Rhmol06G0149300 [Rhododendron molle]